MSTQQNWRRRQREKARKARAKSPPTITYADGRVVTLAPMADDQPWMTRGAAGADVQSNWGM